MLVDPRAELGYLRGDHEPWLQDLLVDWLKRGDTFVDVGSHTGFFAMAAARIVGAEGRVIAIEADVATYDRLTQHVSRNGFVQIRPVNVAAWDHVGTVSFCASGVRGAVTSAGAASGDTVAVRTTRLDDCCEAAPEAVKIDVEGGEVRVLQGAQRILSQRRTRWVIEVHSNALRDDVFSLLSQCGYNTRVIAPRHHVYDDYRQEYVIAIPN